MMGYFSNGTEGMIYQDRYCSKCEHDKDGQCPVWLLHLLYNSEECNNPNSMLHVLIPKVKGDDTTPSHNGKCMLFIEVKEPTK